MKPVEAMKALMPTSYLDLDQLQTTSRRAAVHTLAAYGYLKCYAGAPLSVCTKANKNVEMQTREVFVMSGSSA